VTRIRELGTTLALISYPNSSYFLAPCFGCWLPLTLFLARRFLSPWWWWRHVHPKRRFLQEPQGVTPPEEDILHSHRRGNLKPYTTAVINGFCNRDTMCYLADDNPSQSWSRQGCDATDNYATTISTLAESVQTCPWNVQFIRLKDLTLLLLHTINFHETNRMIRNKTWIFVAFPALSKGTVRGVTESHQIRNIRPYTCSVNCSCGQLKQILVPPYLVEPSSIPSWSSYFEHWSPANLSILHNQ
jgi:hypothetical protein